MKKTGIFHRNRFERDANKHPRAERLHISTSSANFNAYEYIRKPLNSVHHSEAIILPKTSRCLDNSITIPKYTRANSFGLMTGRDFFFHSFFLSFSLLSPANINVSRNKRRRLRRFLRVRKSMLNDVVAEALDGIFSIGDILPHWSATPGWHKAM
jgi:hypothetical protein